MDDKASSKELDQWIEQLNDCKQLTENQVKTLCDKVRFTTTKKKMYNHFSCVICIFFPNYTPRKTRQYLIINVDLFCDLCCVQNAT